MDRSNSSASSVSNFSVAASTAASLRSNTRSAISSPSVSTRNAKSVLSDKYMLGEELGRGAYGQVYKGLDTRTGDTVAIKQMSLSGISQENLQSVMGEIELLKNLNHKNIVKYLGSFKTRTHLYIILEFMENGSLASIIKPTKFGAFPESLVAVYIAQVLQGLAYLHDQGVVHRDIKGANILTTKEVRMCTIPLCLLIYYGSLCCQYLHLTPGHEAVHASRDWSSWQTLELLQSWVSWKRQTTVSACQLLGHRTGWHPRS